MTTLVEATVFVVDDDEAMRESTRWLLESIDLKVECFADAQAFLDAADPDRSGCLILDVRMPKISGLELQEQLHRHDIELPVIVVTGHANVATAIRAMKGGAFELLEKPVDDQLLLDQRPRQQEQPPQMSCSIERSKGKKRYGQQGTLYHD